MVHTGTAVFCKLNVADIKVEVTTWKNLIPITVLPPTFGGVFWIQKAGQVDLTDITATEIYATDNSG
jgi:hypothetical protein